MLALLCGCAHLSLSPRPGPAAAGWVPVHGQYAGKSADPCPVYEVYLTNTGTVDRTFTRAALDGRELPRPGPTPLGRASVALDGLQLKLPLVLPVDPDVVWWQFYPGATAAPGQTTVLQLCFRDDVRTPRTLRAIDEQGVVVDLTIPRRSTMRSPRISAVTYEKDLRKVYVQCDAPGTQPAALWLNGWTVQPARLMTASDPRTPTLVELHPPFALANGMPLDIRVRFDDGRERRALVRVLKGILLDAPGKLGGRGSELSLSPDPGCLLIPIDGVCSDLGAERPGASAWTVLHERERAWVRRPDKLAGFGFCAGLTPTTSSIYGHMTDAVYAKPYRLGWGSNPARFLDEEIDLLAAERDAAIPRPFLYIPERFARHGRTLSPPELEFVQWMAVAMGAKGIRSHFGMNAGGLDASPALVPALVSVGKDIRRFEERLAPLVAIGNEIQGDEKTGFVRVLSAWAGSRGALYLVRDQNLGVIPAAVPVRNDVRVELDVPAWCQGGRITDLRTGATVALAATGRTALTLSELRGFRLLWIEGV